MRLKQSPKEKRGFCHQIMSDVHIKKELEEDQMYMQEVDNDPKVSSCCENRIKW